MITEVVAHGDLRFTIQESGQSIARHFQGDDLFFDEQSEREVSRVFEWSTPVKPNCLKPNLKIVVYEAAVPSRIDHVDITLRNCEIEEFPRLTFEVVEEQS